MSQWTHVVSVFRIDDIRVIGSDMTTDDIEEIIGKPFTYDDMCEWNVDETAKLLPHGSEGSLEYSFHKNPKENCLAAYVLTVFGDLRDYGGFDELETWFKECCDKFNIRQACITMEDEYYGTCYGTIANGKYHRTVVPYERGAVFENR